MIEIAIAADRFWIVAILNPTDAAAPPPALRCDPFTFGVEAFEFISARDPEDGVNVALFTPQTLKGNEPVFQEA